MNSPVNILVAYPYFKRPVLDFIKRQRRDTYRLIVDSGAFSAWNIGKQITLDEYCKFLESIGSISPFKAVQLDVIGNPEATWKNFLIMKKRGFDVMPVFTRGDTIERLDEMYEHTDYIMFGGIVSGEGNLQYIKWFMERNKGRKVHWLGFCNADFVKHFKPYSVDSSSWASGSRFGTIHLYKGFGHLTSFHRSKFLTHPSKKIYEIAKKSGIGDEEIALLQAKNSWIETTAVPSLIKPEKGTAKMLGCIASMHRAYDVEKNLGTQFYLAAAAAHQLEMIFESRKFLIRKGIIQDVKTKTVRRAKREEVSL